MVSWSQPTPTTGGSARRNLVRLYPLDTPYTNALEYLRAVDHRDLPQTIRDCINNDVEITHYIASDLRTAEVRRPLEFKPGMNPGNFQEFGTLRPWYSVHAAFVYITGDENDPPCQSIVAGVRRTKPCTIIFARCIVPCADLNCFSNAEFNSSACANHQYQAEGSRCVLNGVAQTIKHGRTIARAQSSITQAQPTTAPPTTAQLQSAQAHVQFLAAQPGGPQHGSAQTLPGIHAYSHHAPPNSAASAQYPPAQAPSFHGHYVGAGPAQGYAAQDPADDGYNHNHHNPIAADPGLFDENYGVAPLYNGLLTVFQPGVDDFQDFQNFQLAGSAQNAPSQTVTPRAFTAPAQAHHPSAYMSPTYATQDQLGILHPVADTHNADQLHAAGMENAANQGLMSDLVMDDSGADAAYDAPDPGCAQSYGSHKELYDNDGEQI